MGIPTKEYKTLRSILAEPTAGEFLSSLDIDVKESLQRLPETPLVRYFGTRVILTKDQQSAYQEILEKFYSFEEKLESYGKLRQNVLDSARRLGLI